MMGWGDGEDASGDQEASSEAGKKVQGEASASPGRGGIRRQEQNEAKAQEGLPEQEGIVLLFQLARLGRTARALPRDEGLPGLALCSLCPLLRREGGTFVSGREV